MNSPEVRASDVALYRIDATDKHPQDPRADEWLPRGKRQQAMSSAMYDLVNGVCGYLKWLAKRDEQTQSVSSQRAPPAPSNRPARASESTTT